MTNPVRPELYAQVFQDDKRGEAILEELVARFGGGAVFHGELAAAFRTYFNAGQRSVVDFIVLKINMAKGDSNVGQIVDLDGTGGQ